MIHFDVPVLQVRIKELEEEMADPEFWNNLERAQKVNQDVKNLQDRVKKYGCLSSRCEDIFAMMELAEEEDEESLIPEICQEIKDLRTDVDEMQLATLLTGQYDQNNAILSLHAGAGGTEAQDWVSMLYRMYTRYCEKKGYQVKVLDYLDGDEAGIKSVTFMANGENAYGYLKAEKGVHRLVRISPFDAAGRRHTSFASLDVMPEIDDAINIVIDPDDLRIDTYRSSGAGGQHVNKTDSAIRITHLPTNIVVQCQNERSQTQNKETAMKMLKSKLVELRERENMEKLSEIKGELKKIEWGSQIRSYVFHPYSMIKDHRTNAQTSNTDNVMDGDLDMFIQSYLQKL